MICDKCGTEIKEVCFHLEVDVSGDAIKTDFCSRACLIEFTAPELKQAVVVRQWVPTEEETARMSE